MRWLLRMVSLTCSVTYFAPLVSASMNWMPVCTAMGCSVGLSTHPLTGAELRRVAIPGTLSLAWRLGQAVLHARQTKTDAVAAVVKAGQGILLFSGISATHTRTLTITTNGCPGCDACTHRRAFCYPQVYLWHPEKK